MLSEDKFMKNQLLSFYILQLTTSLYTWGIKGKLKEKQTDKDGKLVVLYAGNKMHSTLTSKLHKKRIWSAVISSPIISHLIQKIEGDNKELTFVRVDSDHIDNLIKKIPFLNYLMKSKKD
jgi:molecular chaperone HtpG